MALFLESLFKTDYLSASSFGEMTNYFDLPEDEQWDADFIKFDENGFGFEKFNTDLGPAIGHFGGIDGFTTYALHFPESDKTFVLFLNSVGEDFTAFDIMKEIFKEM